MSGYQYKPKAKHTKPVTMGRKRRRYHGNMGAPRLATDRELMRKTDGFTFSTEAATVAQKKQLHGLAVRFLRHKLCRQFSEEWPDSTFAKVFRMSEAGAAKIRDDADNAPSPEQDLAESVIHNMLQGKVAGIHGNRRSQENRSVFYVVNDWFGNHPQNYRQDYARYANQFMYEYREWLSKDGGEDDD